MPATFGLFFPFKPVVTFIHTNTSFSLNNRLIGRSLVQKYVHYFLIYITSVTSFKLIFTSNQTHHEYCTFLKRNFPKYIIGNGFLPISKPDENPDLFVTKDLPPHNFILSVSQIYRLKNFDKLIEGLKIYNSSSIEPLDLIIVGPVQEPDYFGEIVCLYPSHVYFLNNIPDSRLLSLISNCVFYSNLSLFEGFSLTPGEAILFDKPLLLSDIPVHREIYSNFARFVDPLSPHEISKAISLSVNSPISYSQNEFLDIYSQDAFNKKLFKFLQ